MKIAQEVGKKSWCNALSYLLRRGYTLTKNCQGWNSGDLVTAWKRSRRFFSQRLRIFFCSKCLPYTLILSTVVDHLIKSNVSETTHPSFGVLNRIQRSILPSDYHLDILEKIIKGTATLRICFFLFLGLIWCCCKKVQSIIS